MPKKIDKKTKPNKKPVKASKKLDKEVRNKKLIKVLKNNIGLITGGVFKGRQVLIDSNTNENIFLIERGKNSIGGPVYSWACLECGEFAPDKKCKCNE